MWHLTKSLNMHCLIWQVLINWSQWWGVRCLWKRGAANSRETLRGNCSLQVHRAQSRETEDINSMWHIRHLWPWEKSLSVHVCLTHPWGPTQDGSQKNQDTLHQLLNKITQTQFKKYAKIPRFVQGVDPTMSANVTFLIKQNLNGIRKANTSYAIV